MSAKDNFVQAFKELLSGGDDNAVQDENTPAPVSAEPEVSSATPAAAKAEPEVAVSPLRETAAPSTAVPTPAQEPALPQPAPVQEPAPVREVLAEAPKPAPVFAATPPPAEKKSPFSGFSGFGNKSSSVFGSSSTTQSSVSAPTPVNNSQNSSSDFGGFNSDFDNTSSGFSSYEPPAGVTTIASGTIVIGEIHSKGDMNLFGEIKGNVETVGNITLGGRIMGNIVGNDMTINTSAVKGNVAALGSLSLDNNSIVLGDLKARDGKFDGHIKGNLTIEGLAHFMPDTVLLGNVSVGSLIIDQGARLRGEICTGSRDRFDITDPFQGA